MAQPHKTPLLPPTVRCRSWPLNGANFPWLASTRSWLLLTCWALVTGLVASSKATLWDSLVLPTLVVAVVPAEHQTTSVGWLAKERAGCFLAGPSQPFLHFMMMGTLGSSFTWMMLATNPASMAGFVQKIALLENLFCLWYALQQILS